MITSIYFIDHLCKFELEIFRNSNSQKYFRSCYWCSIKSYFSKNCDIHRKTLILGSCFPLYAFLIWENYKNTYFEELLTATSAFLESVLQEHFSDHNLAKGTFDGPKIFSGSVKSCSNQSRLKKMFLVTKH